MLWGRREEADSAGGHLDSAIWTLLGGMMGMGAERRGAPVDHRRLRWAHLNLRVHPLSVHRASACCLPGPVLEIFPLPKSKSKQAV